MANRSIKRKAQRKQVNSAFQVLPVSGLLTLSTLAAEAIIAVNIMAIDDDFWVQSCDLAWNMQGHTAGQGPLLVGINNGDLSVTEIGECISAVPASRSDIVEREEARRPVRRVGIFPGLSTDEALNDGKVIRTRIKMYLAQGTDLQMYAQNKSGGSLTTGTLIRVFGSIYGEWR